MFNDHDCQVIAKDIISKHEVKRLAEAAFKFHGTYGLPEKTVENTIKKQMCTEQYKSSIANLVSDMKALVILHFKERGQYSV